MDCPFKLEHVARNGIIRGEIDDLHVLCNAIIAKTQEELQDMAKQMGWHWKEVWHGNQH